MFNDVGQCLFARCATDFLHSFGQGATRPWHSLQNEMFVLPSMRVCRGHQAPGMVDIVRVARRTQITHTDRAARLLTLSRKGATQLKMLFGFFRLRLELPSK
jgi:hypothetical protein